MMVATREERSEKQRRRELPYGRPVRPASRRFPSPACTVTAVNLFEVSTTPDGFETVAFPADGTPAPQIEFRMPRDVTGDEAHTLAVRFMRRRGPNYMPAGTRLVITLDARGRQRCVEVVF